MDYSTLTNEQINERLAIEVMGWERGLSSEYGDVTVGYFDVAEKYTISIKDWNPAEDLNQTVMVAEKIGYWNIQRLTKPNAGYRAQVWKLSYLKKAEAFTDNPARALCEAILQAVDNG